MRVPGRLEVLLTLRQPSLERRKKGGAMRTCADMVIRGLAAGLVAEIAHCIQKGFEYR